MSFEIFDKRVPDKRVPEDELGEMFEFLRGSYYAISTLPYEEISIYAEARNIPVKLRRLKNGRVKVRRLS